MTATAVGKVCLAALGAASVFAACGVDDASGSPAPAGMRAAPTPRCATSIEGASAFVVGAQDDPSIVLTMGSGRNGVVLAPMSNGNDCQWIAQAKHFAARGYRVASLSWSRDRASSVELAARLLYHEGARHLVLVGASIGGSTVLDVAPHVQPAPVGVVAISPAVSHAENLDPLGAIAGFDGPLLVVADEEDTIAPVAEAQQVAAAHKDKGNGGDELLVLPGSEHGLNIFTVEPRALQEIDDFLASAFG